MRLGAILPFVIVGLVGCRLGPGEAHAPLPSGPVQVVGRVDPAGYAPAVEPATEVITPGVAAVGPQGPTHVDENTQPFVHFSWPMVRDADALRFELDPPVEGDTMWFDAYRVGFVPKTALELGRTYRVHATGALQAQGGNAVTVDESWELHTRAPSIELVPSGDSVWMGRFYDEDGEAEPHAATPIDVNSELPVTTARLREHVHARAWTIGTDPGTAKPVAIRVYGESDRHPLPAELDGYGTVHVHPATRWPVGHEVEVTLDGTFAPEGAGPIGQAAVARFRVSSGPRMRVFCHEDHGDGCGPSGISFELDAPFTEADLRRIDIVPRPKHFEREVWSDRDVAITGDFELRRYRVRIPSDLRDRLGRPLAGPLPREVEFVPPPPNVTLSAPAGTLRPGLATTVGLESRWLHDATLRAAVPSEREWIAMQGTPLAEIPFPVDTTHRIEKRIDLDPSGRYGWSSIALDIAELAGGTGRPLFVEIVPGKVMDSAKDRPRPAAVRGLYQVTDLGLAAWLSPARSRVEVRSLSSLAPLGSAALEVRDPEGKRLGEKPIGQDGFVELQPRELAHGAAMIVKRGGDQTIAAIPSTALEADEVLRSEIVTERAIYLPGETVSIVGWAVISTPKSEHGLARPKAGTKVLLQLEDHRGDVVARDEVAITPHGKYWGRLQIPGHAPLGSYRAVATIDDTTFMAWFQVRDVRTPQFEVRAVPRDDTRIRGESAEIVAHASYYFGGSVIPQDARASSECRMRWERPPGLSADWELARVDHGDAVPFGSTIAAETIRDPEGTVRVVVPTDALERGTDYVCTTDVAVQDAGFEEVGARATWFVVPTRYLAVRAHARSDGRTWDLLSVDHEGQRRDGPAFALELFRIEERRDDDATVRERLVQVRRCHGDTREHGDDARCDSGSLAPGRYRAVLAATIDGAPVSWIDELWIADPPETRPPIEPRERTSLELHTTPESPQPGETLVVRVLGPKLDGHGRLAFAHVGLRRVIPFELHAGEATLELPVTDAWIPDVELLAFVVAADKGTAPPRSWSTTKRVSVGSESRRLDVAIDAAETTHVGAELPITVQVRDASGAAVQGRVAVWAVDEALHALVEPRIPDLVGRFAQSRYDVQTDFVQTFSQVLRPYETRRDPFELGGYGGRLGGMGFGSGGGGASGGQGSRGGSPLQVRQAFEGTPIFVGDAVIDEHGTAHVRGTMPDNLTTFRLTAIASADAASGPGLARFGHGDARVRVTAPLIVRAAVPRILRPGDEAELAALIENLAGPAGTVALEVDVVAGQELLEITERPAGQVSLAAGGQARVPFSVRARAEGQVDLELRVHMRGTTPLHDAVRVALSIEQPKDLRQHAAAYGSLVADGTYAIELVHPREVEHGAVDVEVELAGTMLGGLERLARELVRYPYGCVEQTTSGLMPLVALQGLAHQGFLDVAIQDHIATGIARLRSMQVDGGGLAYWPGGSTVHVWGTAYALWVLEHLRAAGHEVPSALRDGMLAELRARLGLAGAEGDETLPIQNRLWDRLEIDPVGATIAVQALVAAGERPAELVDALIQHRAALPTFARALLLMAAHGLEHPRAKVLLTEVLAQLDEREGTTTVRPGPTLYDQYFDSQARTEAIVLLALLEVAPQHGAVETLARGLSQLRGIGNTQERAYALLALSRYAQRRETEVPSLRAETWIGDRGGEPVVLEGRTAAAVHRTGEVEIDRGGTVDRVTLRRSGQGRLYWRVGMSWTDPDAGKAADAHGIAIARSLRTGTATDVDHVVAGELVALDVTVTVDHVQRYVAIDLPLPPGLEAVDETLGAGARARVLPSRGGGWIAHRELRRDRAVLFADLLAPGKHTATVFLRSTTPGRFRMPAAVAHAMYSPERRGHTAEATVEVTTR